MRTALFTLFGCACAPALAAGQAFNIDIGYDPQFPTQAPPSASYGAAANQPGTWMFADVGPFNLTTGGTIPALVDITGATTGVSMTLATVTPNDFFALVTSTSNAGTGDAQLLLSDVIYCIGAPFTVTINGLAAGTYDLYTYAMAPDLATFISVVDVVGGTGGPQNVGGAWPGNHVLGVSHALHTVSVGPGGSVVITIDQQNDDSFNGLQIVPSASSSIGSNYCVGTTVANSTGNPGVLTATGSLLAAANNVTLSATGLPPNQFGFFLNSLTQGFVAMPGGSQGNLCLAGAIGRYNGPGLILNSGPGGSFSLALNLPTTPTPSGPTAILASQTWHFQCWYRDLNPIPISNFTNGRTLTFQ